MSRNASLGRLPAIARMVSRGDCTSLRSDFSTFEIFQVIFKYCISDWNNFLDQLLLLILMMYIITIFAILFIVAELHFSHCATERLRNTNRIVILPSMFCSCLLRKLDIVNYLSLQAVFKPHNPWQLATAIRKSIEKYDTQKKG